MKSIKFKALILVLMLTISSLTEAATRYVTNLGDGPNYYGTLRRAINTANSGDEIVILPSGRITLRQGELKIFKKNLTIRSLSPGSVIIDANNRSRIINIKGGWYNFRYNVKLKNLTFVNGTGPIGENGGAVLADLGASGSHLTIENCEFNNNKSRTLVNKTGSYAGFGGAVSSQFSLTIKNSKFQLNSADSEGGAIRQVSTNSNARIENSHFALNSARGGGAISMEFGRLTLKDNSFHNNQALFAGAIVFYGNNDLMIENSRFSYNRATHSAVGYGGALYISDAKSIVVDNSEFEYNQANRDGGAIYFNKADLAKVTHSTIANNTSANFGAGFYLAKDVDGTSFTIENSTLSSNTATGYGGAIYKDSDSDINLLLHHATVTKNSASLGAGIYSHFPAFLGIKKVEFWNSIVAGNFGNDCDGSVFIKADNIMQTMQNCNPILNARGGSNLIIADPGLRALDYYNSSTKTHALLAFSPARDAAAINCILKIDQRYKDKPDSFNDGGCDIGAHENHTLIQ